jgi:hypothetical protein
MGAWEGGFRAGLDEVTKKISLVFQGIELRSSRP